MTHQIRIVFVDDEAVMRDSTAQWLGLAGFAVHTAPDADAALGLVRRIQPQVVVSDIKMPRVTGIELMRSLHAVDAALPVVLLTGHGDVTLAVEAMRLGAYHFIEKPYDPDHLVEVVRKAAAMLDLSREVERLRNGGLDLENRFLGRSPAAEQVRCEIATLAAIDADVIVTGETGVGKEVVAQALHACGRRAAKPYVAINCAAIPDEMFEAELFGYEAGAFTGAKATRIGRLEHANGGTVLLDEIESMPLPLQAKILRVLQERTLERLGSNRSIPIDVRIVAAAKEDLALASREKRFRADLYYRLDVAEIRIPPLRERPGDAALLFARFAAQAAARHGTPPRRIEPEILDRVAAHAWPGNVRELKTVAERFALGLASPILAPAAAEGGRSLAERVAAFERAAILAAIAERGGDMGRVGEDLGLPRRTLNEKMARLGITRRAAEGGLGE